MSRERDEALAAALWAFIERARETEGAANAGVERLTAAELAELAALFRTAGALPAALEREAAAVPGARARVESALAARVSASQGHCPRPLLPGVRRAARAALAVAALALTFLAGRTLPGALPGAPPVAVASVNCGEARAHFAALQADQLPPQEECAVLRHLAGCRSCLDAYHAFREDPAHHHRSSAPNRLVLDPRPQLVARR